MTFEGAASINVEGLSYQSYQQTIFSIGDAIDPMENVINSLRTTKVQRELLSLRTTLSIT